jgi:ABC-type nitrate/sulfonate/bicarbonate transport system permease component
MTIDAAGATKSVVSPGRKRRRWIGSSSSDNLISLFGFVLLVCAWELAIYLFAIPDYILPEFSSTIFR